MADVSLDAHGAVQGTAADTIHNTGRDRRKTEAQDWLSGIEKSNLTPRYYLTIGLLVLQEMFEFYDFFLVGYLVSVLAPGWHLTYGQGAIMLLSSGVGAIAGSLVGGRIADTIGRKKMIWGGGLIFSLGAAGCALIPDGAWILFSMLRFVVGFGSIAAVSAQGPLIVEITPTRYRTFISSMMVVPVALGTMFAAMSSASLLPVIGWRGVAATSVALPTAIPPASQPASFTALWQDQTRFWWVVVIWIGISTGTYGVVLWGPPLLSQLLKITA